MDVWGEVWALAEEQHGSFAYAQAVELGADDGWLSRAARDRKIDRLFRGAYGVHGLLDDWTTLAAAQLVQPRAVAGYTAAAKLQAYDGVDVWRPELLVPPGVRVRGLHTHHVLDLVVPEIVVIDGIRCTDEVRSLIDYAATTDDAHVERAVESIARRNPDAIPLLEDRARALSRPGKAGPARVLRVLANRPETPTESDLETVYWQTLRHFGVELPVRQHWVGSYRVDNAYVDIKLFIELDGYGAHGNRTAFRKDRHRQNEIVGLDWVPLRFTDSDVRHYGRRTAMTTQREVTRRRGRLEAVARV